MDELYSLEVLRLAARLTLLGKLESPHATACRVTKICGSKIEVGVCLKRGRVIAFAQEIRSCVLGQAAASILAAHIVGASIAELDEATKNLRRMLSDGTMPPEGRFWELGALLPAFRYPARHDAILMPFNAALEAAHKAAQSQDNDMTL